MSNASIPNRIESVRVPVVLIDLMLFASGFVAWGFLGGGVTMFGMLFGVPLRVLLDDIGRRSERWSGASGTIRRVGLVLLPLIGIGAVAVVGSEGVAAATVAGFGAAGLIMSATR